MPLYEFVCRACGRRFAWLVGVVADSSPPTCDRCGAVAADRVAVSRFARLRSESETLDSVADAIEGGDPDDPATMRRFARELGSEGGDAFSEYVDDVEAEG